MATGYICVRQIGWMRGGRTSNWHRANMTKLSKIFGALMSKSRMVQLALGVSGLAIANLGCEGLSYRGIAPSARTFADEPTVKDYYVGMNLKFDVLDSSDEKRVAEMRSRAVATGEATPASAKKLKEPEIPDPNLDKPEIVPVPNLPD